jgi:hypothetical protein
MDQCDLLANIAILCNVALDLPYDVTINQFRKLSTKLKIHFPSQDDIYSQILFMSQKFGVSLPLKDGSLSGGITIQEIIAALAVYIVNYWFLVLTRTDLKVKQMNQTRQIENESSSEQGRRQSDVVKQSLLLLTDLPLGFPSREDSTSPANVIANEESESDLVESDPSRSPSPVQVLNDMNLDALSQVSNIADVQVPVLLQEASKTVSESAVRNVRKWEKVETKYLKSQSNGGTSFVARFGGGKK